MRANICKYCRLTIVNFSYNDYWNDTTHGLRMCPTPLMGDEESSELINHAVGYVEHAPRDPQ